MGKKRCKFIDDAAEESDDDKSQRKRRRAKQIASDSEDGSGEDALTKEDREFVVDDHESEDEASPKVRISRKERRITRDDIDLVKENVGLKAPKYKHSKSRSSVWKDSDEDDVHSSDEGFVVDDDEEDEASNGGNEEDEKEECNQESDADGSDREAERRDAFVLDSSNIMSEALRYRYETGMTSVVLADVLAAMHLDGRWVLGVDIMRLGIPPLFVREFSSRCVGCTVVTADVLARLCMGPVDSLGTLVDIPFKVNSHDVEPDSCDVDADTRQVEADTCHVKADTRHVKAVAPALSDAKPVSDSDHTVQDMFKRAPPKTSGSVTGAKALATQAASEFLASNSFYADDVYTEDSEVPSFVDPSVVAVPSPPASLPPSSPDKPASLPPSSLDKPSVEVSASVVPATDCKPPAVSCKPTQADQTKKSLPVPQRVCSIFTAARDKIPVVPIPKPSSKDARKGGSDVRFGLIMRSNGSTYFRHEDGTVEERGRL